MVIKNKSENGQVLLLIVVGFVVILGFVGLAISRKAGGLRPQETRGRR